MNSLLDANNKVIVQETGGRLQRMVFLLCNGFCGYKLQAPMIRNLKKMAFFGKAFYWGKNSC